GAARPAGAARPLPWQTFTLPSPSAVKDAGITTHRGAARRGRPGAPGAAGGPGRAGTARPEDGPWLEVAGQRRAPARRRPERGATPWAAVRPSLGHVL